MGSVDVLARSFRSVAWRRWRWMPFSLRLRVARVRAWSTGHRVLRRGVALVALAAALTFVGRAGNDARAERAQWGTMIDVVIAGTVADAGSGVDAAQVRLVARPRALVVDDAVRVLPPGSARLRVPVRAGEILTARHLMSEARRLAPDDRALAIPTGSSTPRLEEGDLVDLVLVPDPFGDGRAAADDLVAATVLAVEPDDVTVAVPVDRVVAVVRSLAYGEVAVVRR